MPIAAAGAAATVMTTELDEPGSYGRIVRDADGDLERIVEAKHPGRRHPRGARDPRDQHRHVRLRGRSPSSRRSGRITNDNTAGEYYIGDVLPLLRDAGLRRRRPPRRAIPASTSESTPASSSRTSTARRAAASSSATCSPASPSSIPTPPGSTPTSRSSPTRRSSPGARCAARPASGGGPVVGPLTTLIDTAIGAGAAARHSYLVECDVLERCSVGPFAYIRPRTTLARGCAGGRLRRDQGLRRRRRQQGPAPVLCRRRRDRRGRQHRRRVDHGELGWIPQTPHRDRRPCPHRG